MSLTLHIPTRDLSMFYEAGWSLIHGSESPNYVVMAWQNRRPAVVPFASVAEIMEARERWRVNERRERAKEAVE